LADDKILADFNSIVETHCSKFHTQINHLYKFGLCFFLRKLQFYSIKVIKMLHKKQKINDKGGSRLQPSKRDGGRDLPPPKGWLTTATHPLKKLEE
jgi:hypothetical protein